MRSDLTATLAIIGGLGLGFGVMTLAGAGGEQSPAAAASATSPTAPTAPSSVDRQSTPTETGTPSKAKRERHRQRDRGENDRNGRVTRGRPTGIRIDSLGVDTTVTPIQASDGSLVPPADYTTVAWWSDGPAPGSPSGTSIITGHTVHTGGGAFDDLEQLRPGDRVVVERRRRDLEYVVSSVRTYDKGTLAESAATVFSGSTPGRLALVTCEDYNGAVYLSNVVVIATDPEPLRR